MELPLSTNIPPLALRIDRPALISRPAKKVAIVQSNYIPWKGYFDLIAAVDEFILFDDVQYTRRDWRNRNRIKTARGLEWLTIPVEVKGRYLQKIDETRISDEHWGEHHWAKLYNTYHRAPCFSAYAAGFRELYLGIKEQMLCRINHIFITAVCSILGIRTRISRSTMCSAGEGKTERLVSLCRAAGATSYLSGPKAQAYIDPELFRQSGIALEYMEYGPYPEYPQMNGPFEHGVTILDLLFNTGPDAARYMKFCR